jgi:hypothetical protein
MSNLVVTISGDTDDVGMLTLLRAIGDARRAWFNRAHRLTLGVGDWKSGAARAVSAIRDNGFVRWADVASSWHRSASSALSVGLTCIKRGIRTQDWPA